MVNNFKTNFFIFISFSVSVFFSSDSTHAQNNKSLQGVVKVLEAPLFQIPDEKSKVIKYVRKGDKIYLHPLEKNHHTYQELVSRLTEEQKIKWNKSFDENHQDLLITDKEIPSPHPLYIRTLDNRGKDAYVLREHIEILYQDRRELKTKQVSLKDNIDSTEYRLTEPLPDHYPFYQKNQTTGLFTFGMGTHSESSYPYQDEINQEGYDLKKDFIFSWGKQIYVENDQRFQFGGMIKLTNYESVYRFEDRTATERVLTFGVGPFISYEALRLPKTKIISYIGVPINALNSISIKQENVKRKIKDERTYTAINLSPVIGAMALMGKAQDESNFVVGFNLLPELPYYSSTTEKGRQKSWWNNYDDEEYLHQFSFSFSFFIGVYTK